MLSSCSTNASLLPLMANSLFPGARAAEELRLGPVRGSGEGQQEGRCLRARNLTNRLFLAG